MKISAIAASVEFIAQPFLEPLQLSTGSIKRGRDC
jgi:hypothetical protein